MSLTEALSEGLQVTAIGLIIVFSVLLILMLVMMAMKVIFYKPEVAENKQNEVKQNIGTSDIKSNENDVKSVDDTELVAVITAAVAASMNTSVSNIRIKSFKRASGVSSAWKREGVREVIDARF